MNLKFLSALLFVLIFMISWSILYFFFDQIHNNFKGAISGVIAIIFAPKIIKAESQSGRVIQIKWIFLSKVISLKK
ncbi:hypothetical protein [Aureivirga sp. CE67]|uniref:hypothetical protein n=1 Tax=Aureivirga sp. CE67 TaxID=1788983 RepID=UPI0018C9DFD8|nr:hypothetical protein [Aureivirga sp. CE67]